VVPSPSDPQREQERLRQVYQAEKNLGSSRRVQTARATGGGLTWFTEIAESFTWIVCSMGIGCIGYSPFPDTGEGKIDDDLGRGDVGEIGPPEWLDRVRLIEMSVPSRMLFRAFSIANNEFM